MSPLALLLDCYERGKSCALVTLVACHGAAPRRRGAQMAIAADGRVCGSFSGGCLDHAVIEEARQVLAVGGSRRVRYGAESPYVDLIMPCGSGLELQFDGAITADTIRTIADALKQRRPFVLRWTRPDAPPACLFDSQSVESNSHDSPSNDASSQAASSPSAVSIRLQPALRLLLAGSGENLIAMARLARAAEIEVTALSQDGDALADLAGLAVRTVPLRSQHEVPPLDWDPFCAAITLFHEHQWEIPFLVQALAGDGFFVGAMGSVRAQAQRLQQLRDAGVDEPALSRLRGPIGLLPRARDPNELAVSVLADVMQAYRQVAFDES